MALLGGAAGGTSAGALLAPKTQHGVLEEWPLRVLFLLVNQRPNGMFSSKLIERSTYLHALEIMVGDIDTKTRSKNNE
jgi:hypothetical protein